MSLGILTATGMAQDSTLGPSQAQLFDRAIAHEQVEVLQPTGKARPDSLNVDSLVGQPGPALLLGGELRREGSFMGWTPPSLRDAVLLVACDRRHLKKGRERYELPAARDGRAHLWSASFDRPDDGAQTITVTIAPAADEGTGRAWSGTLTVVRRWQQDAPLLASFRASFDLETELTADERKRHGVDAVRMRLEETWNHRTVLDAATAEFRSRVYDAILAGGKAVRKSLAKPDAGDYAAEKPNTHEHGSGQLALAILTALEAGIAPDDEILAAALDELRAREMTNTYCLATAMMAMEALYAPPGERDALLSGRIDAPMQRQPSPSDKALMEQWAQRLLGNIDTTSDAAYVRRYHYHPSTSWDNSNCQYAMLGLYAAQLCGIALSPQVWYASTRHFIDCQRAEDLAPIGLSLLSHDEADAETSRPKRTAGSRRKVEPAGWAYRDDGPASGSMTTAGITGLVIGTAALRQQDKLDRKLAIETQETIQAGFAWFAEHLTVRGNPRTGHATSDSWHFYYLYGLERACELGQVARLQGRDWYFEGAAWLLEDRFDAEGRPRGGLENLCFAVLFLKKAALPVITGR